MFYDWTFFLLFECAEGFPPSVEFLSYFFVKKKPLSRRVEYVVDRSMDQ